MERKIHTWEWDRMSVGRSEPMMQKMRHTPTDTNFSCSIKSHEPCAWETERGRQTWSRSKHHHQERISHTSRWSNTPISFRSNEWRRRFWSCRSGRRKTIKEEKKHWNKTEKVGTRITICDQKSISHRLQFVVLDLSNHFVRLFTQCGLWTRTSKKMFSINFTRNSLTQGQKSTTVTTTKKTAHIIQQCLPALVCHPRAWRHT